MKRSILKACLVMLLLGITSILAAPNQNFTPTGIPRPIAHYDATAKSQIFTAWPWSIILDTIKVPQNSTYDLIAPPDSVPLLTVNYNQAGTSLSALRGPQPLSFWGSTSAQKVVGNFNEWLNSNQLVLKPRSATYPTVNISTHRRMTQQSQDVSSGISFQGQQTLGGTTYYGYAELDVIALYQYLKKQYQLVWTSGLGYAWPLSTASKAAIKKATYKQVKYPMGGGTYTIKIGQDRPNGWPLMISLNISIDPQADSIVVIDSISIVLNDRQAKGPIVTITGDELKTAGILTAGQGKNPYIANQSGS